MKQRSVTMKRNSYNINRSHQFTDADQDAYLQNLLIKTKNDINTHQFLVSVPLASLTTQPILQMKKLWQIMLVNINFSLCIMDRQKEKDFISHIIF